MNSGFATATQAAEPQQPTALNGVMAQTQEVENILQRCLRKINRLQEQMVGPTLTSLGGEKAVNPATHCVKGCLDSLNGTALALDNAIDRLMSS